MASKTFLELQTEALRQVDDTLSNSKALIKSGINESYTEISSIKDWETLLNNTSVNTVNGTAEYTPISSSTSVPRIRRIESIINETSDKYIEEIRRDVFEKTYGYVTSSDIGDPLIWYVSGYNTNRDIKFKLYKTPDGVYSIRVNYFEEPLELLQDGDEPRIPDQWHYGLIYLGIARYYEFQKDPAANYYRELHEEYKGKILRSEFDNTDEMPSFQPQSKSNTYIKGKIGRIYNA